MRTVSYIDDFQIQDRRVLLRLDLNVSLDAHNHIADDARVTQTLPTIERLLSAKNRIIIVSHLGRPTSNNRDKKYSLSVVVARLKKYLPDISISLVSDFTKDRDALDKQKPGTILVLENIRYYEGEKQNDKQFAKELASLADVYVNDAFAVSHRAEASVVGVTQFLPSYGGLLLKKELTMIDAAVRDPKKPVVVILGGSKISTKINLIGRLLTIADQLLIGGGMANTFLAAHNMEVGKSIYEYHEKENARRLIYEADAKHTTIILPVDAVCGTPTDENKSTVKKIGTIERTDDILDIGPETQAIWGAAIAAARTIIWNGPVGYFENPAFRRGTDFIYYAITQNTECTSIVGGGDTLAAISKKEYLENITHISTGGGAMLEYIEKGTLPGIEALKHTQQTS